MQLKETIVQNPPDRFGERCERSTLLDPFQYHGRIGFLATAEVCVQQCQESYDLVNVSNIP